MNAGSTHYFANLSTRKAFAIHLTLSLLVFSSLVFVMLMWWFPGELFFLDGGWQGLKIIALIDLVLGPLLTLVLYKPGKKSLLLDMSLVAAFQLVALGYGFYATHQQRTVAVVYADKNFTTLSAATAKIAAVELQKLELEPQRIRDLDKSYPALLLTPEPAPGKFGEYVQQLFNGYPESHERLDLFQNLGDESLREKHLAMLDRNVKPQEDLELLGADVFVAEALKKDDYDLDDTEIHHFKARYAKGLVLFSKSEQKILDYIPIDWDALLAKQEAESPELDESESADSDKPKLHAAQADETENTESSESTVNGSEPANTSTLNKD